MRKLLSTVLVSSAIITASMGAYADIPGNIVPNIKTHSENTDVRFSDSRADITINGGNGALGDLTWETFNVGKDATVDFKFMGQNQTALNKVEATGGMSQIYGNITNSGVGASTGKVILLNPNGVLFGNGANVNLNSFTVSTFDGNYDNDSKTLNLTRGENDKNIYVLEGATIQGEKGLIFAANNIDLYRGSVLKTKIDGLESAIAGKVKLVTADGVNFTYAEDGQLKSDNITNSTSQMYIQANGTIEAGDIELVNKSSNAESYINLNGANLKAVRAVKDSEGNIYLTSDNNVIIGGNSTFTTEGEYADASQGGKLKIEAGKKATLASSTVTTKGDVEVKSTAGDVVIDSAIINAGNNIKVDSKKIASVQNRSQLNAEKDITVIADEGRTQLNNSMVIAKGKISAESNKSLYTKSSEIHGGSIAFLADRVHSKQTQFVSDSGDISLKATGDVTLRNSDIESKGKVEINAVNDDALVDGTIIEADNDITINGYKTVTIQNKSNVNSKTNLKATANDGTILLKNSDVAATNAVNFTSTEGSVKTESAEIMAKDITLNAGNNIVTTSSAFNNTSSEESGNIEFSANNAITMTGSGINSKANASLTATTGDITIDSTSINSQGNTSLTAGNAAALRNKSNLTATGDIQILATAGDVSVSETELTSKNITATSEQGSFSAANAKFKASYGDVALAGKGGDIRFNNSQINGSKSISLESYNTINGEEAFVESTFITPNDISVKSSNGDINFKNGIPLTAVRGKLTLDAHNNLSIINDSEFNEANAYADDVNVWLTEFDLHARNGKITLNSKNGDVRVGSKVTLDANDGIDITADKGDVTIYKLNLENNIKANVKAGNNVDIKNVVNGSEAPGIVAEAGNDIKIESKEDVPVDSLKAGNDITLNVNGVISKTSGESHGGYFESENDSDDSALFDAGNTFTSNLELTEEQTKTEPQGEGKNLKKQKGKFGEADVLIYSREAAVAEPLPSPSISENPKADDVSPDVEESNQGYVGEVEKKADGGDDGGHGGGDSALPVI